MEVTDDVYKRKSIEENLDKGYGSCVLKDSRCAQIVLEAWKFFDGQRYDLIACVVMPNHVHVFIKTYEAVTLGKIVQSWKAYTAREIKDVFKTADEQNYKANAERISVLPAILREGAAFRQREYWDRFIRDEKHFSDAICYIIESPVKAGLVNEWKDWPWIFYVS